MQQNPSHNAARAWVIQPHRSLTWPEARRWLWLLSLIPTTSGILALACGAPLVLPFAGLEVALLWAAFYYVDHTGRWREVVRVEGERVVIEKGRNGPRETHVFERSWVRVELRQPAHAWHPTRLYMTSHGREVDLGSFLTDGERAALARALINGIRETR